MYYSYKSKSKTIKFVEENTGQCFHELEIDVDCLHRMQKNTNLKGND